MAPNTTTFEPSSSPCSPSSPCCSSSSSEKRFTCSECSQTFQRSEHLRRHIRTHSGVRPFACTFPGCNKTFSRSDNMAMHQRSHIQKNSRKIIRELKAKEKLLQAEREKVLGGKEYQFVVENGLVRIPKKTFHPYRPDPLFHQLLSSDDAADACLASTHSSSSSSSSSHPSASSLFDRASSPLSSSDDTQCQSPLSSSPSCDSFPTLFSSSLPSPITPTSSSPSPSTLFPPTLLGAPFRFDPSFSPQISLPAPMVSKAATPRHSIDSFYLALF